MLILGSELFQFVWSVPATGHQWVTIPKCPNELFLTTGAPFGEPQKAWRYAPLEVYSGLFRNFAETALTQDGIVGFANKYGRLGLSPEDVGPQLKSKLRSFFVGEPFSAWRREIASLREAVALWDSAHSGDPKRLKRQIRWGQETVSYESTRSDNSRIGLALHKETDSAIFERLRPGDAIGAAWFFLQRIVNRELRHRVAPRLLWEQERLALFNVPNGLLGALWLQFAQAIGGKKDYQRCVQCAAWFEIAPGVGRKGKTYCSDACRSAAYRRRKEIRS